MRNLKYIKLFEAFDSRILSKTLGYINNESRITFLDIIKDICSVIDFPMSELSDEYFEYLSFKSALNKNIITNDEPCTAKSIDLFNRLYGIEGETCHDGRIKRKWGKRTREVVCTACNGTGIKPKKSNVELLKFWFNADGKYLITTGVDGVIRPQFSGQVGVAVEFYNLEHGKKYLMKLKPNDPDFIEGTIYKTGAYVYFIHNSDLHDGDSPQVETDWHIYGRYSWVITGDLHHQTPILAVENKDNIKIDAYSWNVGISIDKYKIISNNRNIRLLIGDANFAIVLDYEKLKTKEFQKKSITRSNREEIKKHSLIDPEQTSKNIKRKNIERYFDTIVKNTDIISNIANCNKVISRILTYRSSIYIIRYTDIIPELISILKKYMEILDPNNNDTVKKTYIQEINDNIRQLSKRNMSLSNKVQNNIKIVKDLLLKNKPHNYELYIKILDEIDEISLVLSRRIKEYDVETIEDFEIIFQKINMVKNIIKSDRYRMSSLFDYLPSYICQGNIDRAYQILINEIYFNSSRVEYDLDRIKSIFNRI